MAKTIVITGRGGSGKTTFAALATRYLPTPQLLIDADSDQNLAAMLGIDLEAAGVKTISDALYELQSSRRGSADLDTMPLPKKIEYLVHTNCVYEGPDFDLVSIGVKWTQGCYCAPNDILRAIVPALARNHACTVVDAPGGLEHLNRRITSRVDDLFVIMDPSAKSRRNLERTQAIAAEVGITYQNLYLVANHQFSPDKLELVRDIPEAVYLGQVPADPLVPTYDWQDRSLRELPESAPAVAAVREILAKAGYS